jgi:hypothetical protein
MYDKKLLFLIIQLEPPEDEYPSLPYPLNAQLKPNNTISL